MIEVKFKEKTLRDQIAIIKDFLSDINDMSIVIADYFGVDIYQDIQSKDSDIEEKVTRLYNERKPEFEKSINHFQQLWDSKSKFINRELTKVFGKEFTFECDAYINLNPVWPRYLDTHSFDVNIDADDNFLLASATHEICHFIWFSIWKENFPNCSRECYDYPHLEWLISEIVVEPIFKFSNLKELSITPAYDYFYTDSVNGETVVDIANRIYSESENISDFQYKIYDYFISFSHSSLAIK